jgi:nucleoside-diphosphate-sugar epimerase
MHFLIVWCGYLGRRAARDWLAGGHSVTALTRSPATAESLRSAGIEPIVGDLLDRERRSARRGCAVDCHHARFGQRRVEARTTG